MQHILVTGGTGTLGQHVISQLRNAGYDLRVLSRSPRQSRDGIHYLTGDLSTGEGVEVAVQGTEIIVHCAGSSKGDEEKTRNLVRAASHAGGVRHLVYISVVGADKVPVVSGIDRAMFGYFAEKRAAERLVMDSGIPWTILRATQFHDLLFTVANAMVKLPILPVFAGFRFQPVDAGEVATRLVQLALGEPAGLVPDFAGPKIYTQADLMRAYLHVTHQRRLLVPIWLPGQAARAHRRDGVNLSPDHADGKRTWEEFLTDKVGSSKIVPTQPFLA